ncbi:MAG: YncE family protein [Bryobacteraceae bacterium]
MRRFAIAFLLLFACGISAVALDSAASPQGPLVYVLDSAGQTVTAVDLASGKTTGAVAVGGKDAFGMFDQAGLDTILLTPDGSRLVRLDPGEQKVTARFGLHPLEKSTAAVIDTKTMQIVARAELGWGLSSYRVTPDRKVLVAICSGYQSQKPEETLPSELVTMNLSTGEVLGRLALSRAPASFMLSKDGATAILFHAQKTERKEASTPADLEFIGVEQHAAIGRITLDGAPGLPVLSPAGDYMYLIEKGQPFGKPEKRVNGRIHVVSVNKMKEEAILDAGLDPRGVMTDDAAGQTLLLSTGFPVKGEKQVDGELRVIHGAAVASVVKVGFAPQFIRLSPDRKRLYVAGWGELTAIDYQSLHELGRTPPIGAIGELAFAPGGKLGFALHPESSKLSILDLDALKPVASVTTGRGGIKFAKGLGAVALTAASATAAYGQAYNMAAANGGYGFATYQIFTVAPANTSIAVRPDGAFVYVLNSQTHDVTIVNTSTSAVVDKIATGGWKILNTVSASGADQMEAEGRAFLLLNGGGVLVAVGRNCLHLIDTKTQKALPEVSFDKNLLDFRLSPDGQSALALVEGSVVVLNGTTGEVRARIAGFKHPRKAVFAQEASAPQPASEQAATAR